MSAFYDLSKTPRKILNQAIVKAIVAESNGAWFDPSDMTTLYQDAAGTTPVTAVEQPVGKILDKSGNGNHATQSITASRPTLSARYNLLTKTEDFSDAAWGKNNCTVATNTTTDPFGGTNADTITGSSSASNAYMYQAVPAMISGATYTVSRYVKAGSVTKCTLGMHGLADIYFDLNALTYNVIGTGFVSASIVDVGNGWRKITGSWVWSGNVYQVYFALASTLSSQIGVPVGGYLYTFGHSLVLGTTPGPYQRVNTATDYDTDERYFPKYLRFDGVDDYLNLPYMGLYAGGSASVVAAITVSPATWSTILAEGGGGGLYILARYTGTNKLGTFIQDDNLQELETPITQGITTVFSVVDAGSAITHWVSGRLAGSSNYTRSGTLTNAVTLVGARPYLDTLNGNLYGLIITKSALSDAQRIKCERYAASKAGVIL